MVAIGMLLGPHGVGLIHADLTESIEPLTLFLLGWVGLIVGFGADRRLPALMPKFVWPLAAMDLLLSLLLIGGAAALFLWVQEDRPEWSVAVLLGASAVGWSPEVRSLLGGVRITAW